MIISIHPRPFEVALARSDRSYSRHFSRDWKSIDVKASSVFAEILTTSVWSPIRFEGGHRLAANFRGARLLVLDFDDPGYPLAQCINEWCDTVHWIGTTKSHQRPKGGITCDRFRLVVPFTGEISDPAQYEFNYGTIAARYDADTKVKDQARLFFPCQEIVSTQLDGELQPILPLPEGWADRHRRYEQRSAAYREAGFIPVHVRRKLEDIVPQGKRNTAWYGFAKDLAAYYDHADIVQMVLASATYRGSVMSPSLIKEIEDTTARGYKDGRQTLSDV